MPLPTSLRFHASTVRIVQERLGSALWQAQLFEEVLANYLTIVFKADREEGEAKARAVFEQTSKKTLGQLVSELKQYERIDPHLGDALQDFVRERNWLVHRSRRENHADLYDVAKASSLVERLDKFADAALDLCRRFATVLEEHLVRSGVTTREELERNALHILREWGAI